MEFKEWPKIPRLGNESYYITEKLDGTNACIVITEDGQIGAQSRTRLITPGDDNFGFARWVDENKDDLKSLGVGHHFGEWWGQGIQRGYGLQEKRFSLFSWWLDEIPECCSRVPVFSTHDIKQAKEELVEGGSKAVPGWMNPEGLVLCSRHYKTYYKVILDKGL